MGRSTRGWLALRRAHVVPPHGVRRRPYRDREVRRRRGPPPAAVRRRRDRLTHDHPPPPGIRLHNRKARPMTDTPTPQDTPDVVAAAMTDGATTLFVADFADTRTAWEAYEALKSIEDGRHVAIDGVIVVKREADGDLTVQKATDHSTKRGLTWGLVGGATLGLLFHPHSWAAPPPSARVARRSARPGSCTTAWGSRGKLERAITPGHYPASSPSSPTRPSSRSVEHWRGRMRSSSQRSTMSSPRTSRPSRRKPPRNDPNRSPRSRCTWSAARSSASARWWAPSSWFSLGAAATARTPPSRRRRPR